MFKFLTRLFDNKFASPPAKVESFSVSDLLKMATDKREAGDVDSATEFLRRAYAEIGDDYNSHSINTFLRLPLYLQKAGRNDEAWREFNLLLTRNHSNPVQNPKLLPMEHCQIYDKMRLFLQRDEKFDNAIRFGIWSYISWAIGLHRQRRKAELKNYIDRENIEEYIVVLLKKAKKLNLKNELADLIEAETKALPDVDLGNLGRKIDEIVFRQNKIKNPLSVRTK